MSITKLIPCPTCGYPLDETEQKGLATLTEQAMAQDKWISGLTQPDNCLPVYAVKNFTMRFKEYKPSSQQAKRGIIGRWQEHDGYGWTNCEPPEKYSTTPPKEAE